MIIVHSMNTGSPVNHTANIQVAIGFPKLHCLGCCSGIGLRIRVQGSRAFCDVKVLFLVPFRTSRRRDADDKRVF